MLSLLHCIHLSAGATGYFAVFPYFQLRKIATLQDTLILYKTVCCVWSVPKQFSQFGVEDVDLPAKSPDLNSIRHHRDELERRLCARPSQKSGGCSVCRSMAITLEQDAHNHLWVSCSGVHMLLLL